MALTKVSRGLVNTSIEDNGNATAITIDSSENVGIGITNPSDYYAENLVVGAADEGGITIESGATEKTYLMFAQGTSGQSAYRGFIGYDHNTSLEIMNVASSGVLNFITGSSQTERMRIDASGRVTMPYQPAFNARSNSSTMQITQGVVPYSIATVNTGSGYSTSTYRFTAPVAGQYLISWYGLLGDQNTNGIVSTSELYIRKNGSQIVNCHSNNNDYWEHASCTTVVSLAVNDYVDVYLNSGGIFYGNSINHYSKFCGYLIG